MFAESLLESGNVHHKGRGWATTLSVTLQALLLAALVALPIFRPDKLLLEPKPASPSIAFGVPERPPEPQRPQQGSTTPSQNSHVITAPPTIPSEIPRNDAGPTSDVPPIPCLGDCNLPVGDPRSKLGSISIGLVPVAPIVVKPPERPPVVSVLKLGGLIHQVQPVYPRPAQQIRLEGTVLLRALIDREGRVTSLQVLSGHPFFVNAARDAVSQWRYRPYVLNGQPVEVETQITVNFKLNH